MCTFWWEDAMNFRAFTSHGLLAKVLSLVTAKWLVDLDRYSESNFWIVIKRECYSCRFLVDMILC